MASKTILATGTKSKPRDLKTSEDVSVWTLARRFFEIMHVSLRAHETDMLHLGAQTHSILPFRLNSGFTLTEAVQYCEPLRYVLSIFPAVDFDGS